MVICRGFASLPLHHRLHPQGLAQRLKAGLSDFSEQGAAGFGQGQGQGLLLRRQLQGPASDGSRMENMAPKRIALPRTSAACNSSSDSIANSGAIGEPARELR